MKEYKVSFLEKLWCHVCREMKRKIFAPSMLIRVKFEGVISSVMDFRIKTSCIAQKLYITNKMNTIQKCSHEPFEMEIRLPDNGDRAASNQEHVLTFISFSSELLP